MEHNQSQFSIIRATDPNIGVQSATIYGYIPGREKGYFIQYRTNEGDIRRVFFEDTPSNPGSDYSRFLSRFTGSINDPDP